MTQRTACLVAPEQLLRREGQEATLLRDYPPVIGGQRHLTRQVRTTGLDEVLHA
jgi:hypothetical protein